MANKLDRIEKDIEKTKAKIAELQKQLRELEAAKTEQENLQIIQLVRGLNMKPEEFAAFLRGGALQSAPAPQPDLNRRTMPMKNKIIRTFTVTLAAVLCLTAFSTTAFAGGTDPNPEPLPETTEAPQEEEPTTGGMEPEGVPVTPEGNATLVDDFMGISSLSPLPPRQATTSTSSLTGPTRTRKPPFTSSTKWTTLTCKHCWRTAKPPRKPVPVRPSARREPSTRIARYVKPI